MKRHVFTPASLCFLVTLVAAASPALAAEEDGKAIFLRSKCNSCHTVTSLAIAQPVLEGDSPEDEADKPPDLSDVGSKHKPEWFAEWLQKKVEMNGKTHRKRFGGKPEELKILTAWLAGLKKAP